MTPIEYIILGILAVFAALVGSFALRNSGERAVQEDIKELGAIREETDERQLLQLLREQTLQRYREQTLRAWEEYHEEQAKARREATERAWSKNHAAYAPRRELIRQRARKKP